VEDFRRLIVEAIPPGHRVFRAAAEQWHRKELATRPFAEPLDVLLAEPDEPLRFLVDRLVVAGASGWIGGEPKSLKSWLALYLGLCIACGVAVFGKYPVPERARVLYLQEEDGRRRVRRRIRKILKGLGVEAPSGDFFRCSIKQGVLLDDEQWIAALRAELKEYRPALVVADVFELMHTKDSMERAELKPVFYTLNRQQEEFGCGFLLADHFKKSTLGGSKRGGQRLSGTVGKHAWGESSLYLFPGPRKHTVLVETELKDAPSEAFTLTLADTEDGGVVFEWAAEADAKADQMKAKILEALESIGGRAEWVTTKAVAEAAGVSSNTAGKWLGLLLDEDRKVERDRRPVGKTTRVEWKLRA
jgi:RecA-family ATPase